MLQNSYLPLVPHSGQFTVYLYNKLERISISLNTFSIQNLKKALLYGPHGKNTNLFQMKLHIHFGEPQCSNFFFADPSISPLNHQLDLSSYPFAFYLE